MNAAVAAFFIPGSAVITLGMLDGSVDLSRVDDWNNHLEGRRALLPGFPSFFAMDREKGWGPVAVGRPHLKKVP